MGKLAINNIPRRVHIPPQYWEIKKAMLQIRLLISYNKWLAATMCISVLDHEVLRVNDNCFYILQNQGGAASTSQDRIMELHCAGKITYKL